MTCAWYTHIVSKKDVIAGTFLFNWTLSDMNSKLKIVSLYISHSNVD